MNVLLVGWDAAGGLLPVLGLTRRLAERGHDVRLLANPSIDRRCGRHGWRFRPFQTTPDYDVTVAKDMSTELQVNSRKLWFNPAVGRDIEAELAREPADLLVIDCMLFAGLSAALATGMPTAAFFHQAYSSFMSRGEMLLPPLNAARAQMGLDAVTGVGDLYSQCDLCIVAVPRELEGEHVEIPSNVCWVGPILDGPALITDVGPLPDLGNERFIVISLGTGYQDQLPVLQRLVDAAGQLAVRAIVTTGPAIAPQELKLPTNITAVRYVPHDLLLPRAELVVTHAGLGTVMAALREGLPLLCIPLGRDQFANAAWVESTGTGRALPADSDPAFVAEAMSALLDPDAAERTAAKRMARSFEGYRGADAAAEALERLKAALTVHPLESGPAPVRTAAVAPAHGDRQPGHAG